jgi:hypothetical protein
MIFEKCLLLFFVAMADGMAVNGGMKDDRIGTQYFNMIIFLSDAE